MLRMSRTEQVHGAVSSASLPSQADVKEEEEEEEELEKMADHVTSKSSSSSATPVAPTRSRFYFESDTLALKNNPE